MMRAMRRLYRWVLSWADRPGGVHALFWLAFAESSFFPVPPDVLLVALGVGAPKRALRFATIAGVGSVLGGVFGYLIGLLFMDSVGNWLLDLYSAHAMYDTVKTWFDAYGVLIVGVAGFTPIPYKVFTIAGGAFGINFPLFIIASLVSRFARFYLVGLLIKWKGAVAREFIDRHLDWIIVAFTVLLVAGYFLLVNWRSS